LMMMMMMMMMLEFTAAMKQPRNLHLPPPADCRRFQAPLALLQALQMT
jgi:hypothetical protein